VGWLISERASPDKPRFSRSVRGPRPLEAVRGFVLPRFSIQTFFSLPNTRSPVWAFAADENGDSRSKSCRTSLGYIATPTKITAIPVTR
jgi:hypothetical protein